jgi:hypothetical protein
LGGNPLASAGKLRQCHPQIFLGADEVDIRGNQFGQVVHQLLEDELVLSEELVLSDTFEHRPQCQRIEFYIEIRGSAADQDSDAKVNFFQGSSTFLHDTTRKNVTFQPSDASCVFVSYIALFANSDFCLAWGNRLAPWTTILHIHKASIPSPSGTPKEVVT